jgi:hypothetical protein
VTDAVNQRFKVLRSKVKVQIRKSFDFYCPQTCPPFFWGITHLPASPERFAMAGVGLTQIIK